MIEVIRRKLNPRYYKGPISAVICRDFKYDIEYNKSVSQSAQSNMTEWVVRVEKAMQAFEQFRCQGVIEAMVVSNMIGYGTEGTLFVFDDQTNDAMSSVVAELFRVLNDKPRQTELYMACFIITLKMETVYIQDEGVDVPFEELDTEPYQRPKATKVVTLPSPILN